MAAVRDEKGRFIKGHPDIGAGRKPRATEDDFLNLIDAAVSVGDWTEIICKAKAQAKRGDAVARSWLVERMFGKVAQRQELTGAVELTWRKFIEGADGS